MKYIPRLLKVQILESLKNRKVLFIIGARQVGKTTLMQRILQSHSGVILNMDIAVDESRLRAAGQLSPDKAMQTLGVKDGDILVIDEAHRYPEMGRIVKGWYDADVNVKVVLMGSSSLNLLDKTAESLAGRNEKLFLTPLTFAEILQEEDWYTKEFTKKQLQENFQDQIKSLLIQQLVFGSYPESWTTEDKENYLINLASDYLLKDILQTGLVKNPEIIKRLLLLLAHQTGGQVSNNELATNLAISRPTVDRYLDLLEQIYVIFRLPSFSTNPRKEVSKSKKIYFWDVGVRNALLKEFSTFQQRSDIGALWENWVVAEFAKKNLTLRENKRLHFWRSYNDSEVDLVIKDTQGNLNAFEIKWSTRKTKVSRAFEKEYGIRPVIVHPKNFVEFTV